MSPLVKRLTGLLSLAVLAGTMLLAPHMVMAADTTGVCLCKEDNECVTPASGTTDFSIPADTDPADFAQRILDTCTFVCRQNDGVYGGVHDTNITRLNAAVQAGCESDADFVQVYAGQLTQMGIGGDKPAEAQPVQEYVTPQLSVPIPGMQPFTKPVLLDDGTISVDFLGQYINGVYNFVIGAAVTVAIVILMVGGLRYILGAQTGDIKGAKQMIQNAVIGLVLLLAVYVILFTVNPQLTLFNAMKVSNIANIGFEVESSEFQPNAVSGQVAIAFARPTAPNVKGNLEGIAEELTPDVDAAAGELAKQGYGMLITSTFRTVADQIAIIRKNCQNAPGSASCNPKPGRPQTCILQGNDPARCPHTTGRALDVWATKTTSKGIPVSCVSLDQCIADRASCFNDPCQAALITEMRKQGFCVLNIEPWHFEQPRMSSNCN